LDTVGRLADSADIVDLYSAAQEGPDAFRAQVAGSLTGLMVGATCLTVVAGTSLRPLLWVSEPDARS
jgi:hypothetical protein